MLHFGGVLVRRNTVLHRQCNVSLLLVISSHLSCCQCLSGV